MRYLLYGLVAVMCLAMVAAVQVKAHSRYPPECRSHADIPAAQATVFAVPPCGGPASWAAR
jgi:hypothetical protein